MSRESPGARNRYNQCRRRALERLAVNDMTAMERCMWPLRAPFPVGHQVVMEEAFAYADALADQIAPSFDQIFPVKDTQP